MVDLGHAAQALLRHARLILTIVGVFALVSLVAGVLTPKTYFASAVVMLEPHKPQVVDNPQEAQTGPPDASDVASELEQFALPNLGRAPGRQANLTADPKESESRRL